MSRLYQNTNSVTNTVDSVTITADYVTRTVDYVTSIVDSVTALLSWRRKYTHVFPLRGSRSSYDKSQSCYIRETTVANQLTTFGMRNVN